MARTSLPPQANEAALTPPPPQTAAAQTSPPPLPMTVLRMPPIGMIIRIITLACLTLSVSLLASNSATITTGDFTISIHFKDIYAYRYALSTAVIGLCYTFFVLLSSIKQVRSGKLPDPKILVYEFLGDKVLLALLATGVGAAFGATVDLKSRMDEVEDALEIVTTIYAPIVAKFDDFFNKAYIPTIFLLFGFLTSGVSSLLSSLALMKKNT